MDVDGVLADFVSSHIDLIREKFGIELPPVSNEYPKIWDYPLEFLTPEQDEQVWKAIAESFNFWMRLKPLAEGIAVMSKLRLVETAHDIYFITNRPGATAKFQTEAWLLKWFTLPTVLIAKEKGPLVKSLKLDVFVDDNPGNANEAAEALDGKGIVMMPDRPYNRNVIVDARVARVKSVEKTLGAVLGWDMTARMVA